MKIRNGIYTLYDGFIFRLSNEITHFSLLYDGENCPFPWFKKYVDGIYYTDVPTNKVTNAFGIDTFCIYKGYQFGVRNINTNMGRMNIVRIGTNDKEAYVALNLKSDEDKFPGYDAEVNINEFDRMWETRKPSTYCGLPFPTGLNEIEEIIWRHL